MIQLNQNFSAYKKHVKLFFYTLISFFIIIFVSVIFIENKNFNKKKELKVIHKIYKKYDARFYKFYLLKHFEPNHVIIGTSSALVFDPLFFKKYNKESLNLAYGGGKVSEHYGFVKYIVENKKKVNEIIIELRHYSFTDIEFNSSYPMTVSNNKFSNFLNFLNTKSYKFYLELIYNHFILSFSDNYRNVDNHYFNTGTRLDDPLRKNFTKKAPISFDGNFSNFEYKKLIEIKKLCEDNNIRLILFFGPISSIQKKFNNEKFLNKEKNLIKKMQKEFKIVYDFKNFQDNLNIKLNGENFYDHIHYDYKIAEVIVNKIYD